MRNPRQNAKPLQVTITHTFTHYKEMSERCQSARNKCLWTDRGTQRTLGKLLQNRENMQTLHTEDGGGNRTPKISISQVPLDRATKSFYTIEG